MRGNLKQSNTLKIQNQKYVNFNRIHWIASTYTTWPRYCFLFENVIPWEALAYKELHEPEQELFVDVVNAYLAMDYRCVESKMTRK